MKGRALVRDVTSIWMAVLLLGSQPWPLQAQEAKRGPYAKHGRHTIHLVNVSLPRDPDLTEALNGVVASLEEGQETVILFDGSSPALLRMHAHREKRTLLHDIEIAGPERQSVADHLGVALADAPRNYFDYVQRLAKSGVRVVANRDSMRRLGLTEEEIHPIATLVSAGQVSDILDQSDFCDTVGTP